MNQPKVFEYAKEIGMETLALMDKIREWGLPVKNHMVELDELVIQEIQKRLSGAATEAVKTEKSVKKKKTEKKTVEKKVVVAAADDAAPKKTAKKTKKKTVIRRKKSDLEAQEEAAGLEAAKESQEEALAATDVAVEEAVPAAVTVQVAEASVEEVKPVIEEKTEAKPIARKVAVNVADGETSGVKSIPKNIIGRMDLSRITPPSGQNRGGAPSSGASGGDLRQPRTGTRNIRPGFVAAPMPPAFLPETDSRKKFEEKKQPKKPASPKEGETISFSTAEFRKREMVFQPKKKKGLLSREAKKTEITTPKASKRVVKIHETISVSDLAQEIGVKAPQLIKLLMKNGVMATMNQVLDFDTVALIVPELGWEALNVHRSVDELLEKAAFGNLSAEPVSRPPVVTVMGHVDHGKTTLLDSIRKANVAKGEAGGITQHIAAYSVRLADEKVITFIDTPGHEAFTAMRARGANVTDIAVIVVAADDGVMPQTAEAVNHAKAANVPIIVAVNKMDKPDANPDRIKQQLTEFELVPEEWGGSTIFVPVSALKGEGIGKLLEQIYLLAEVSELKANPERSGTGIVIESRMEKGRGFVSTLLVKDGTVRVGQFIVAGKVAGKIRSLINDQGQTVDEAGPSVPVEMLGFSEATEAGDRFDICQDEATAQAIASARKQQDHVVDTSVSSKMSLDALFAKVKAGNVKELPLVLKTDVAGSNEAIKGMLDKLNTEEVKVKLIHSAVGAISESDVLLAKSAGGIVLGFNVRPDGGAAQAAKTEGVEIKTYRIVYELVDDIKKAMSGLLEPDVIEQVHGRAEVRETFSVPKIGTIAGCSVIDGKVARSHLLRLTRNGIVIYEGKISSLKRFKDDVKEVQQGYECGIGIENFNDLKTGDVIEAFTKETVARQLS